MPIIAQADFAHLITRQMRSLTSLSNQFNSWRASYISWLSIYHSSEGIWTPEQNAARKGLEATLHIACRFRASPAAPFQKHSASRLSVRRRAAGPTPQEAAEMQKAMQAAMKDPQVSRCNAECRQHCTGFTVLSSHEVGSSNSGSCTRERCRLHRRCLQCKKP